uniref:Hedgehog/Intein (Hint) domain-containing protein n=1 Tax=viral metagenome TaxID=1070528 RepID=A0A6C0AXS4_9ZZZZ|tara:strand:+ start:571 stop:1668 length:1098 start_codon:yes stop_codon:yes gene_type:complete
MATVFTKTDNTSATVPVSGTITSSNYPAGFNTGNIKSVVIGTDVTSIGNYAFYQCSALQSVTIPDSVTSVGKQAFESCSALQSVTIPDSVTSIGNYAFYFCITLQSVTIGNSVTSIGIGAFSSCSALDNIYPQGIDALGLTLETIDWDVFNKTNVGNFSLPDTLITINDYALRGSNIDTLYVSQILLDRFDKTTGVQTIYGKSNVNVVLFVSPSNQVICFPENTPITTDQGIIAIQDLEKDSYTINGNKVLGVVSHKPKSSIDMVLFKQHALGYNIPSKDTLMTRNHQVYYNNIPREAIAYTTNAFKLNKTILKGVPNNPKPKVMQYNKEVYNVMLEDGHKMKVNNMLVETLDPSNKLYKQKLLK